MALTLIVSFSGSSLVKNNKSTIYSSLPPCSCSSFTTNSCSKTLKFHPFSQFSQLGMSHFTPWNGLKHMGISISAKPSKKLGKGPKCRGKVVYASLFGVGAPEALVIGVVALLVFGPKGLAEVARNLGKTLRAFQPTIKELQEVSREFKNTLEREISLDDDPIETKNTSFSNTANPTSTSSVSSSEESPTVPMAEPNGAVPNKAYSSEEYPNITEEQLKARQEALSSSPESQVEAGSEPQASVALEQNVLPSSPETTIELESQTQEGLVPKKAYTSEEYLKFTEEQLTARQEALSSSPQNQIQAKSEPQANVALQQDALPSSPETKMELESQTQAVQQEVMSSPSQSTIEPKSEAQAVQETANATTSDLSSES